MAETPKDMEDICPLIMVGMANAPGSTRSVVQQDSQQSADFVSFTEYNQARELRERDSTDMHIRALKAEAAMEDSANKNGSPSRRPRQSSKPMTSTKPGRSIQERLEQANQSDDEGHSSNLNAEYIAKLEMKQEKKLMVERQFEHKRVLQHRGKQSCGEHQPNSKDTHKLGVQHTREQDERDHEQRRPRQIRSQNDNTRNQFQGSSRQQLTGPIAHRKNGSDRVASLQRDLSQHAFSGTGRSDISVESSSSGGASPLEDFRLHEPNQFEKNKSNSRGIARPKQLPLIDTLNAADPSTSSSPLTNRSAAGNSVSSGASSPHTIGMLTPTGSSITRTPKSHWSPDPSEPHLPSGRSLFILRTNSDEDYRSNLVRRQASSPIPYQPESTSNSHRSRRNSNSPQPQQILVDRRRSLMGEANQQYSRSLSPSNSRTSGQQQSSPKYAPATTAHATSGTGRPKSRLSHRYSAPIPHTNCGPQLRCNRYSPSNESPMSRGTAPSLHETYQGNRSHEHTHQSHRNSRESSMVHQPPGVVESDHTLSSSGSLVTSSFTVRPHGIEPHAESEAEQVKRLLVAKRQESSEEIKLEAAPTPLRRHQRRNSDVSNRPRRASAEPDLLTPNSRSKTFPVGNSFPRPSSVPLEHHQRTDNTPNHHRPTSPLVPQPSLVRSHAIERDSGNREEVATTGTGDNRMVRAGSSEMSDTTKNNRVPSPRRLTATKMELINLGHLGKGTGGIVNKALHISALKLVAVKSVPVNDHRKRRQIVAELKLLYNNIYPLGNSDDTESSGEESSSKVLQSSHPCPYIVGFYDAFVQHSDSTINLVLELMHGGSLQDLLDASNGPLPELMIANIGFCVLEGLKFIHSKRQIHRDIKPSNILVSRDGGIVKISDFGISHTFGSQSRSKAKTFVGSVSYMAPERILTSDDGYSYASDIWSLGLTLLVCALGGENPFMEPSEGFFGLMHAISTLPAPQLLPRGVTDANGKEGTHSPEFCRFVSLCLEKDPKARATVTTLFDHPFIIKNKANVREPNGNSTTIRYGSEAATLLMGRGGSWVEFGKLVEMVVDHHAKNSAIDSLPKYSIKQLAALAVQVGILCNEEILEHVLVDMNNRFERLRSSELNPLEEQVQVTTGTSFVHINAGSSASANHSTANTPYIEPIRSVIRSTHASGHDQISSTVSESNTEASAREASSPRSSRQGRKKTTKRVTFGRS